MPGQASTASDCASTWVHGVTMNSMMAPEVKVANIVHDGEGTQAMTVLCVKR